MRNLIVGLIGAAFFTTGCRGMSLAEFTNDVQELTHPDFDRSSRAFYRLSSPNVPDSALLLILFDERVMPVSVGLLDTLVGLADPPRRREGEEIVVGDVAECILATRYPEFFAIDMRKKSRNERRVEWEQKLRRAGTIPVRRP